MPTCVTRRTLLILVAALVAAAFGAGAGILSASGHHQAVRTTHAPASGVGSGPQILHFTSKTTKSSYMDNTRKGLSAGDVMTQHSVWYRGGKEAGTMALTATITRRTSAETGEVLFTAVALMDQGQIVMTGKFDILPQDQTFDAAVTGGTGRFGGTRGQALFRQTSASTTQVTLILIS